jgi:pentalenic acid synthase
VIVTDLSTTPLLDPTPSYPLERTCPYQPPEGYAEIRANGPVSPGRLFNGRRAWLVTGHAEAREVLLDAATYSSDRSDPRYPAIAPRFEAARKVRNFIGMDPPEHTAQRRMLISRFTVRSTNALRPAIQQLVDRRLDEVERVGPGADLVSLLALPVTSTVISELLGVPYADHEFFELQSRRIATGTTGLADSADAFAQLSGYLDELIRGKQEQPGDGLLDLLIAEQVGSGALTRPQLVGIALLLLVAGHETTANTISLGVLSLLADPEQARLLTADPAAVSRAVDELLRYTSVADGVGRFATRNAELAGQTITAGDGLIVVLSAANRDPAAFPDPDVLDISRPARHHAAFGHGIHQCIGQNLGRAELEIVFASLFARFPGLRLAEPADRLPGKDAAGVQGVGRLPVAW